MKKAYTKNVFWALCAALFLFCSIFCFADGNPAGGIVCLSFGTPTAIAYVVLTKKAIEECQKEEEISRAVNALMKAEIEREYMRKQVLLENLNEEYALGLYDGDIYAIARADDPSAALQKFVKPGLPSLEEYRENFSNLLHIITHGVGLSEEEADEAEADMLEINEECGEEVVVAFADACSNLMYGDLAFLNGKINYLLCVTAIFSVYAENTGNIFWANKANVIREKRGYGTQ